jgi:hypothetical protein
VAYSVNWITKVVSIPTADLTLVSGNHYSLDMADFLAECRRLEWEFTEGLWAPAIVDHGDTRINFAGANYAPFDEIINGYTIQITGTATRVDLLGSNNNLVDILIPTGVSVVPSNSAGLQIVSTGSGLSAAQDAKLTSIDTRTAYHDKIINNFKELKKVGSSWYLIIYDDGQVSGGTEILRKKLEDASGNDISDLAAGTLAAELASTA